MTLAAEVTSKTNAHQTGLLEWYSPKPIKKEDVDKVVQRGIDACRKRITEYKVDESKGQFGWRTVERGDNEILVHVIWDGQFPIDKKKYTRIV